MNKFIVLLWLVVSASSLSAGEITYPQQDWSIDFSHHFGVSAEELDELETYLESLNTQALHVSVNGEQIYAYGAISDDGYLASVRKSILAMLYGKYVADGSIDLDKTLFDLGMDDIQGLSARERQASIRDLIKARSGIYHPASNGGDSSADAPPRGSQEPGSYYLYNNWDFNATGAAFELMTGKDIFQELNDQFAEPLGFQDFDLSKHKKTGNPERSKYLAYHMHLSARDLARVGLLMLAKGQWQNKQLFPAQWADEMVFAHTPNEQMNPPKVKASGLEYGYMWWVFDNDTMPPAYKGAYAGRGHFGQYLAVLPELGLVISHKTKAIRYKGPEEYAKVRVTWDQFMGIVERLVDGLTN